GETDREARPCSAPPAPSSTLASQLALERVVEQLQDPLVLVGPARLLLEAMVLDRERRDRPVVLPELDEALHQPHAVLEQHVGVDHAVADEQRAFEAFGEIDRRAP